MGAAARPRGSGQHFGDLLFPAPCSLLPAPCCQSDLTNSTSHPCLRQCIQPPLIRKPQPRPRPQCCFPRSNTYALPADRSGAQTPRLQPTRLPIPICPWRWPHGSHAHAVTSASPRTEHTCSLRRRRTLVGRGLTKAPSTQQNNSQVRHATTHHGKTRHATTRHDTTRQATTQHDTARKPPEKKTHHFPLSAARRATQSERSPPREGRAQQSTQLTEAGWRQAGRQTSYSWLALLAAVRAGWLAGPTWL